MGGAERDRDRDRERQREEWREGREGRGHFCLICFKSEFNRSTRKHTHTRTHARTHAQNIKSVKVCRPRRQNTPRCVPVVSDNVTVIRCPLCLNLVALLVIVLQHCWSGCRKVRRTANINTESKFRSFAVFLTLPSYQPNP